MKRSSYAQSQGPAHRRLAVEAQPAGKRRLSGRRCALVDVHNIVENALPPRLLLGRVPDDK